MKIIERSDFGSSMTGPLKAHHGESFHGILWVDGMLKPTDTGIGSVWKSPENTYILLRKDIEYVALYPFRGGRIKKEFYEPGYVTAVTEEQILHAGFKRAELKEARKTGWHSREF